MLTQTQIYETMPSILNLSLKLAEGAESDAPGTECRKDMLVVTIEDDFQAA